MFLCRRIAAPVVHVCLCNVSIVRLNLHALCRRALTLSIPGITNRAPLRSQSQGPASCAWHASCASCWSALLLCMIAGSGPGSGIPHLESTCCARAFQPPTPESVEILLLRFKNRRCVRPCCACFAGLAACPRLAKRASSNSTF